MKSADRGEDGCHYCSGIHAAMSNLRSSGQARCANCSTRSLFIIYEEKTLTHGDRGDELQLHEVFSSCFRFMSWLGALLEIVMYGYV